MMSGFARTALILGVMLAASAVQAAPAAKPGASTSDTAAARVIMNQGVDRLNAKDPKGAEAEFHAVIDNPHFSLLDAKIRYYAFYLLATAETRDGDAAAAYDHLLQAAAAAPDARNGSYWWSMMDVASTLDKRDEIADAIVTLARTFPDTLSDIDDWYIRSAIRKARKGALQRGPAHYQAALEALVAINYHPSDLFQDAEYLKLDLTRLYADEGKTDAAKTLAATLVEPSSIVPLQVDKRYAGLISPDPARYMQALADDVATARKQAADHPDRIEGAQTLASALLSDDKPEEALTLIDAALAKATAQPGAYSDLDNQLRWALETRNEVLMRLGRWDEALAAEIQARDVSKDDKVSQRINLADLYVRIGRPADAIAEVKTVDAKNTSAYGSTAAEVARACAYAALGDKTSMTAALDFLKAHADDTNGILQEGLTCAGDVDALTVLMVKQLDDPDLRNSALIASQVWLPDPHRTAWDRKLDAVNAQVAARPEIRAAVEKYGIVNSYPKIR